MSAARLLRLIARTGRVAEPLGPATEHGLQVREGFEPPRALRGSVGVRHVDAGSCNGCELEIGAAFGTVSLQLGLVGEQETQGLAGRREQLPDRRDHQGVTDLATDALLAHDAGTAQDFVMVALEHIENTAAYSTNAQKAHFD